jgi:PTS system nitrogen regulatory IIA component
MNDDGHFADLLRGEAVLFDLAAADKAAAFEALAAQAAPLAGLPASLILEHVQTREALGSTGFGQGAAIPHARLATLDTLTVVLARLATAIDYDALDHQPVDIIVLLLSPENAGADHLKALARISRTLRNRKTLTAIRAAPDAAALRRAVSGSPSTAPSTTPSATPRAA